MRVVHEPVPLPQMPVPMFLGHMGWRVWCFEEAHNAAACLATQLACLSWQALVWTAMGAV